MTAGSPTPPLPGELAFDTIIGSSRSTALPSVRRMLRSLPECVLPAVSPDINDVLHTVSRACLLHCRSINDKILQMRKEAARLSPDKAESTNRKARQTILKNLDAMRASVDSLSAKQGA